MGTGDYTLEAAGTGGSGVGVQTPCTPPPPPSKKKKD